MLEAVKEGLGRQEVAPGCRQLDGERQAIQLLADRRHRGRVLRGYGKVILRRTGPRGEESHRIVLTEVLDGREVSKIRDRKGRDAHIMLTVDTQHRSARDEDLESRARGEEIGNERRCGQEMLEVVENQEQLAPP